MLSNGNDGKIVLNLFASIDNNSAYAVLISNFILLDLVQTV